MRRIICAFTAVLASFLFCTTACAESYTPEYEKGIYTIPVGSHYALLHDLDNSLTDSEESMLTNYIINTVEKLDFSVAIVITDNIGEDKSDYAVMDYADVYYEEYCGIDTDGILLLLNNDTKYDWISTSGKCIEIYEYSIDYIFDDIWEYVLDGDYCLAGKYFCYSIDDYYNHNDYLNDGYYYDDGYYYEGNYSLDIYPEDFFGFLIVSLFVILITLAIFKSIINSNYRLSKNQKASNYVLKDSLVFSQKTDTYLRTYTTRTRVDSYSSSGRSGSRRSGSSHRSSGGGRHGGGGRRR